MSGGLRTQIGLARGRLKDALERIGELFTTEELATDEPTEVLEEIKEICAIADVLQREKERILQLDDRWQRLISIDSDETAVMTKYKAEYGEYMDDIKPVASKLVELEKLYATACNTHRAKSTTKTVYPVFPQAELVEKERSLGSQAPGTTTVSSSALGAIVKESTVKESTVKESNGDSSTVSQPKESTTIGALGTTSNYSPDQGIPQNGGPIPTTINPAQTSMGMSAVTSTGHNGMGFAMLPGYNLNPFQVTLPSIKLPTFNGDHLQFVTFMELFNTLIGQQPMSEMAKFHYLVSCLDGEARTLIQFLPMTESNYRHALQILKDNYGNLFRTRQQLMRQLQDLPSVANSKNTKEMLNFWTRTTVAFNQLKTISPECDNMITADLLMRKLPRFYISKLIGNGQQTEYTASTLLESVHRIIQTDQLISTVFDHPSKEEKSTTMALQSRNAASNQPGQVHQNKQNGVRAHVPPENFVPRTPCAFCVSKEHYHRHHECPTYRTASERQERARQLKLCFKCLKMHDNFRSCTRVPKCRKCQGNHQTSFCKTVPISTSADQHLQQGVTSRVPFNDSRQPRSDGGAQRSTAPGPPFQQNQQQPNQPRTAHSSSNLPQQQNAGNRGTFIPRGRGTTNAVVTEEYESDAIIATVTESVQLHVKEDTSDQNALIKEAPTMVLEKKKSVTQPVAMMTTQVLIDDKDGNPVLATVFFDSGSDRSFISTDLVNKLKLPVDSEQKLSLNTFANNESTALTTKNFLVHFNLNEEKLCIKLTEIPLITTTINFVQLTDAIGPTLLHSQRLQLPRLQVRPDILIGLDQMSRVLGETSCQMLPNGMTMHHTDCGIIITGRERQEPLPPDIEPFRSLSHIFTSLHNNVELGVLHTDVQEEHQALRDLMERFWTLDNIDGAESALNKDEEDAHKFFVDTTTRGADGRYTVRWPYREATDNLSDNRFLALYRLQSTMKRLSKDSELGKKYHDIILDQLARDFVEFVDDENHMDGNVLHYLSHHPIIKMSSKSTKVRMVFDASAHNKDSKSLNDVLHTGMSLLPMIPGVLIRIRCPQILISGDIEKAFLQLGLDLRDRDACRFLWQFPDESEPRCLRFKRVPFGVKTSPYLLNATIKHHLQKDGTEISKRMLRNVYVDNIFIGVSSQEEGQRSFKESKAVFQEAQMRLTQYFSNSAELNDYMNNEEGVKAEEDEQKILGIEWNIKSDQLRAETSEATHGTTHQTKDSQINCNRL